MPGSGRLIIVCGLPGAGKTTLARRLETEHAAFRFCPDEWMSDLGVDLFDGTLRDRVEQLQWGIARRLLQQGVVVVIEWGTWDRSDRDQLRAGARQVGATVELRFLDVPFDVRWQRVELRDASRSLGRRPLTRTEMRSFDDMLEAPDADELALFDPPDGNVTPLH